jgi:hypothetical protein
MKQIGATEENNPEFAKLVQLIRFYGEQVRKLQQQQTPSQDVRLSQQQMGTLRFELFN